MRARGYISQLGRLHTKFTKGHESREEPFSCLSLPFVSFVFQTSLHNREPLLSIDVLFYVGKHNRIQANEVREADAHLPCMSCPHLWYQLLCQSQGPLEPWPGRRLPDCLTEPGNSYTYDNK